MAAGVYYGAIEEGIKKSVKSSGDEAEIGEVQERGYGTVAVMPTPTLTPRLKLVGVDS
jgi:hypothetical protein